MRAFAVLLLIGGVATAGMPPPAAYECTLGSSGCVCGAGEVDVRDSADVERCTPAPSGDDEPALAAAMARSRATTYYACGELLVDEYNRNPEAATNDRVLFDAALCYQRAHQLGGAVIALRLLTKYYPRSPLNAPALLGSARVYDAITLDDHAAEQYEAFATTAPHDPDAPAALARAIELRLGLRDLDSARRDGDRYEHAYGGSPGGEAIAFSLLAARGVAGATAYVGALDAYLARYGGSAPAAHGTIANAELGATLWRLGCPVDLADDALCIERAHGHVKVIPRADAAAALGRLTRAVAAYDGSDEARAAFALARALLDDADLEAALAGRDGATAEAALAAHRRAPVTRVAPARTPPAPHDLVLLLAPEGVVGGAGVGPVFDRALARFVEADRTGAWTPATCRAITGAFESVAAGDALYMAGLAHERCDELAAADAAYTRVLALGDHPRARSNHARLEWLAGDRAAAETDWQTASKAAGKLFGARLGLAAVALAKLAGAGERAERVKADEEARFELANAIVIEPADERAFVMRAELDLLMDRRELGAARLRGTSVAALVIRGAYTLAR